MKYKLVIFLLVTLFAHLAVWVQLNSQFLNDKLRASNPWMLLLGVPISWLWMKSTAYGVEAFDGKFWPQRFIAFAVGIVLYTLLTHHFFGEKMDLKSITCLALAFTIVGIQFFWK